MEKLLTITVPVYNTEQYLPKCLDSLIVNNDLMDVLQVLIVIDGSPDNSVKVAQAYADKYPDTFFVIEKENGGHGSAINKGLELATGKYFKVLDSDDWFDTEVFKQFLDNLQRIDADVVLTDVVREFVFENRQAVDSVKEPVGKIFNYFPEYNALAMAKQTYKLSLLKDSNLKLPEKMFYVDTIYARQPMLYAQSFIYYNYPLYRYFIGRSGQSVSIESSLRNREHYKYVFKFLYEQEREILRGRIKELELYKTLNNLIYSVLSHLDYQKSKEELKEWDRYIRNNVVEREIKSGKVYYLYNLLPFFIYKALFLSYLNLKKLFKK